MSTLQKSQPIPMSWLDPRNKRYMQAGVAFFIPEYGEFALKIDEEPSDKVYYVKPVAIEKEKVLYRVELVLKDKNGKFLKRKVVGDGYSSQDPSSNIYLNYGSKYKTLVLFLEEKNHDDQ